MQGKISVDVVKIRILFKHAVVMLQYFKQVLQNLSTHFWMKTFKQTYICAELTDYFLFLIFVLISKLISIVYPAYPFQDVYILGLNYHLFQ